MSTHSFADTLNNNKIIILTPLEYAEVVRTAAAPSIAELNKAAVTLKQHQDTAAEKERVYGEALARIEDLTDRLNKVSTHADELASDCDAIDELLKISPIDDRVLYLKKVLAENERLQKRVAELEKPPVIVTPEPPKPETEQHPVFPFTGVYIEDERAVDNLSQAQARYNAMLPAMDFAYESPLNDYIIFCNPEDLKLAMLPKTMNAQGKRWWQSPIQAYYEPNAQTQIPLIDHLKKLHDAGVYGAVIDDAQNLTAPDMEHLIDLINRHIPDAPIMASFLADFDDHTGGYPFERYYDMRQWFLRQREDEGVWFEKWETAHDAQVYAADVWKRGGGFMHTPERIQSMFKTALPMVEGIAWYSLYNKETDHRADHLKAIQTNPEAKTIWSVMIACTNEYLREYEARRVKA